MGGIGGLSERLLDGGKDVMGVKNIAIFVTVVFGTCTVMEGNQNLK